MNEITKIHLGRQAFTIATDAYKALQVYLHAIKRQVGEKSEDVTDEIELRMAELLVERGVSGDKVVLLQDVEYLKQQLGTPGDFSEESDEHSESAGEDSATKRLFRDTDNAMLAGVCAGIAKYTGIEVTWIRLAFAAFTLLGASSVLLYLVLWLIMPEAKTKSERLQMQGKPVTIDSIKEVVEAADVEGAAKRAGDAMGKAARTVGGAVHNILKAILAVAGVALMIGAVAALLGLVTGSVYWALNHDVLIPFNIFPVGVAENVLVYVAVLVCFLFSIFLLVAGLSMVKRKWSLPGWALGVMLTLFLGGIAVTAALGADAVPKVSKRFEAAHHSDVRLTKPFTKVSVIGDDTYSRLLEVQRRNADQYKVEIRYLGGADTSNVTVKEIEAGVLEVNAIGFKSDSDCVNPCVFDGRDIQVFIYAPADKQVSIVGTGTAWYVIPADTLDEWTGEPVEPIEPAQSELPSASGN